MNIRGVVGLGLLFAAVSSLAQESQPDKQPSKRSVRRFGGPIDIRCQPEASSAYTGRVDLLRSPETQGVWKKLSDEKVEYFPNGKVHNRRVEVFEDDVIQSNRIRFSGIGPLYEFLNTDRNMGKKGFIYEWIFKESGKPLSEEIRRPSAIDVVKYRADWIFSPTPREDLVTLKTRHYWGAELQNRIFKIDLTNSQGRILNWSYWTSTDRNPVETRKFSLTSQYFDDRIQLNDRCIEKTPGGGWITDGIPHPGTWWQKVLTQVLETDENGRLVYEECLDKNVPILVRSWEYWPNANLRRTEEITLDTERARERIVKTYDLCGNETSIKITTNSQPERIDRTLHTYTRSANGTLIQHDEQYFGEAKRPLRQTFYFYDQTGKLERMEIRVGDQEVRALYTYGP